MPTSWPSRPIAIAAALFIVDGIWWMAAAPLYIIRIRRLGRAPRRGPIEELAEPIGARFGHRGVA